MAAENHLHIETPLLFSDPLSRRLGSLVSLKLECLQPSGSFKNRGIGNYCRKRSLEGATQFVSSSGGNAGLAASYAARLLGTPITVFVPAGTPKMMIEKMKIERADIVIKGVDWQEADGFAKAHCQTQNACYVPPFDHPDIWEGNATLMHEIAHKDFKPDAVVVAVGGGGLFCGLLEGMHNVGWQKVPVYAVETEGAASFAAAKAAGKAVEIEKIDTLAKSLGARRVCDKAVEWTKNHRIESVVVSDAQAVETCSVFVKEHRILVEPACGAALSLCTNPDSPLKQYRNVLVVVCGGSCVSIDLLSQWLEVVK